MIDVYQRIAMDAPEARISKTLLQNFQRLRGHVFLLRGHDPNDVSVGLKRVDLVSAKKKILLANFSHNLAVQRGSARVADLLQMRQLFNGFPAGNTFCTFNRLSQTLLANRLQKVIDGARFESLQRVFVIRRNDDDYGHMSPTSDVADYV